MDANYGFPRQPEIDTVSTYIALSAAPSSSTSITLHRLTHKARVSALPTSLTASSATTVTTPVHHILDAKFADDATLVLLVQSTSGEKPCSLISLPYNPASAPVPKHLVAFPPVSSDKIPSTLLPKGHALPTSSRHSVALSAEDVEHYTRHIFEGRFTPLKLVINGRKGRRAVVVVGSDKKHYRVLDLDFEEGQEGEGESGSGESDVEMSGA